MRRWHILSLESPPRSCETVILLNSSVPHLLRGRASIYEVRTEGGRGCQKIPQIWGQTVHIQGSRIRFVVGCVILRAGAVARSRNLGQALFGSPVCCRQKGEGENFLDANVMYGSPLVSLAAKLSAAAVCNSDGSLIDLPSTSAKSAGRSTWPPPSGSK